MTAMLVLEPIFEADLPPEIYAYRAGRNTQQAAVEVEEGAEGRSITASVGRGSRPRRATSRVRPTPRWREMDWNHRYPTKKQL
jgi:hypothetical protein